MFRKGEISFIAEINEKKKIKYPCRGAYRGKTYSVNLNLIVVKGINTY